MLSATVFLCLAALTARESLAAENAAAAADFQRASDYVLGENGVEQDFTKGVRLMRQGAEAGFVKAQLFMGYFLKTGTGVDRDDVEALRWFEAAAKAGDGDAQFELALCDGRGAAKDFTKAAS